MNTTWDPDLYLKFRQERTQPSMDLVRRVELEDPKRIVDIGCGPGNSTGVLRERWPQAAVTGVDSSCEMITAARTEHPAATWVLADARELPAAPRYDLVYSNAAIQWIPDHEALIPHLLGLVSPGGALAVQVPLYREMPVSDAITSVSQRGRWCDLMVGCDSEFTFHGMEFYYDLCLDAVRELSVWQTWYVHEMDSHALIVEMMSSTGMRRFLERLVSDEDRSRFKTDVLESLRGAYPQQRNGRVLFPFKRLFLVAYT